MNSAAFTGVTAVIITPYADDGTVAPEIATRLAGQADAAGIDVITALGNTGEVQQLDAAERRTMLRAIAAGRDRAQLLAGVIGSAGDVIASAEDAASLGYHAIMVHEPADPFGASADVARYYELVAERSPLPVVLYLRSPRLAVPDLGRLVRHPGIAAVKYARDDLLGLSTLLTDSRPEPVDRTRPEPVGHMRPEPVEGPAECVWINGLAESRVPAFAALGITGFTTGIGNIYPEICVAIRDATIAGEQSRLYALLDLIRPIEVLRAVGGGRFNVSVLKELLRLRGIPAGDVRPPHAPLDETARAELHRVVAGLEPETLRTLGVADS